MNTNNNVNNYKIVNFEIYKELSKMANIPFKVSARTARLIGRENIATSKGAIIELVKNGYDADSKISIVYFDNYHSAIQENISKEEYNFLMQKGIYVEALNDIYELIDDNYSLKKEIEDQKKSEFRKLLNKLNSLYIIDAGEGMTQQIIRDHWMTIGTDNKEQDVFTKTGRVKAGAKGIGRFALDKLGSKCEMITVFNPDPEINDADVDETRALTDFTGYNWVVNWEDFEGDFKTIDKVNAELNGIKPSSLKEVLIKYLPHLDMSKFHNEVNFQYGTILKITDLRENWEDFYVDQVYSDLEVLVPPKENGEFEIHLLSSLTPEKYGEVLGSVCDDYDYKIIAKADENQNVKIKIYRSEYDLELIDPEFFNRETMKKYPYQKVDFLNGYWEITKTFSQLLPGYSLVDEANVFKDIGVFDFSFYFMKRTYNSYDAERFSYRKFMANFRKDWLDKFGGVKLFRDNFRVRPYGEVRDSAFDWLALGSRKAQSPAGVAKEDGGYRVEPENVAGAIKISRLTNLDFEDKSSREGLQENKTFLIFKKIITEIISIFEEDRSFIASEMSQYYNEKWSDEINKEKAEALAKSILDRKRKKKAEKQNNPDSEDAGTEETQETDELTILAELNKEKDEEIEKLRDEQKVLRGLASSGIVLASFSHDLSKLNNVLNSRVDKLRNLISEKVFETDYLEVEERKNPFAQMEKMKKQDVKLQNWLNFSLGAARKDKRKRNQLFLNKYFNDFKNDWATVLENRGIELDISNVAPIDMRVFEIDIDSIFNNLVVNSIDAFNLSKVNRQRAVTISVQNSIKEITIDYHDNGPGLSPDIDKPEKIFDALFTTKRNIHTGEEEGTGLGMWIVKSIVHDNDGVVKLLFPPEGFGLRISFPIKYKKV